MPLCLRRCIRFLPWARRGSIASQASAPVIELADYRDLFTADQHCPGFQPWAGDRAAAPTVAWR